jgi:hypothetical protein
MVQEFKILWAKKNSTKDLVFRILITDQDLKLIELNNLIKKRYGKSATFQAVRQAVNELIEDNVLEKKGKTYNINKIWVLEAKKTLSQIENNIINITKPVEFESIKGEFSTYKFSNLNELMIFWQHIVDEWFSNFKKGDYNINCWQGQHLWEILIHLDREKKVMEQMKKKGIKSYALIYGDTPLDNYTRRFYESINIKTRNISSHKGFDNEYYVGTYGDIIIQTKYPKKISNEINFLFQKTKSLDNLNLKKLHDIINKTIEIKLIIIKNLEMAKQINHNIIEKIE